MSNGPYDPVHNPRCYEEWDAEKALADAVAADRLEIESYEDQTRRHLKQAAPAAAMSIIKTALYSTNERLKYQASQYIVDRMLGRIGEEKLSGSDSPLEAFLADVVQFANTGGTDNG